MSSNKIPDGVPENFTGESDHMEFGSTGMFAKGTRVVDADGRELILEEEEEEEEKD